MSSHHPGIVDSERVEEALRIVRDDDDTSDADNMAILDAAHTTVWDKVSTSTGYVMLPHEFAVFNFFQQQHVGDARAVAARKLYWDSTGTSSAGFKSKKRPFTEEIPVPVPRRVPPVPNTPRRRWLLGLKAMMDSRFKGPKVGGFGKNKATTRAGRRFVTFSKKTALLYLLWMVSSRLLSLVLLGPNE